MLIEVKQILPDGTIIIKQLDKEKLPIEGEQYNIFFSSIKPDEVPEFNR